MLEVLIAYWFVKIFVECTVIIILCVSMIAVWGSFLWFIVAIVMECIDWIKGGIHEINKD